MTLLGKLKLGFRAVVLAVALLMALNFGELLWINAWQGQTDAEFTNAQVAGQMINTVERMNTTVEDVKTAVAQDETVARLLNAFENYHSVALASLTEIAGNQEAGSEEAAKVESLIEDLSAYAQAGYDLMRSDDLSIQNAGGRAIQVIGLGTALLSQARIYQATTEADIAAKLDQLGLVGLVCLIVTAALGAAAVIGGLVVAWRLPRSMGRELNAAATGIGASAAELMAVASQVAASAAQTAASTNETTVTVEEVKQTAILASEKASEVVESVSGATTATESGIEQVEGTIAGIERMSDSMDVVFETITRLSERALAAGDVIAAVNDLAEQSNLLSVNASIEAAKAGEYGKGFTVVAQEVKSLAEQSKQAVSQVRTILSEIRKASETAVQAAEQGRESIEAGRKQSVQAGEVIQNLAEGASGVSQSAVQISASSRQQLAGMEQISQAISSINEAGNQSAAGTRQVEQEVKHLQELAVQLKKLVQTDTPTVAE